MTNTYDVIDLATWKRRDLYDFYRTFVNPTCDLMADARITRFYEAVKDAGHPFFLSFLYAIAHACQQVDELRLRISPEGEVRRYHHIHPGSTLLRDDGTFGFGYFSYESSFRAFLDKGRQVLTAFQETRTFDPRQDDLARIYCSPLPWVSFRGFRHPFSGRGTHSIPMIIFGRHEERGGERTIPVGITLHHALADGYH